MSNPLPTREEAWNCNRCRDRRTVIAWWDGTLTAPCPKCPPAEVGSLPLPEEMQTDVGGAGAGSVGGPSHDTEPHMLPPITPEIALELEAFYTSKGRAASGLDMWAHTDPCCKGGPDCLCEPEGL